MVSINTDPRELEHVLQWCRTLVHTINDGGVWGIPRSGVVFKIDKKKQCLILTVGDKTNEDFIATRRVFAQIGWDVFTQEEYEQADE